MIEIAFDQRDVRRVHRNLVFTAGWHLMGAMATASEEASEEIESLFADELEKRINAPRAELKSRLERNEPVATTRMRVESQITVSSRRIPIKTFGPVQTSAGVVYHPYLARRAKVLRHAFGPNINRLGRHVYVRKGKPRTPIQKVPGMNLQNDPVAMQATSATQQQVPAILARHMAKHVRMLVDHQFGIRRGYRGFNRKVTAGRELNIGRFGKVRQS